MRQLETATGFPGQVTQKLDIRLLRQTNRVDRGALVFQRWQQGIENAFFLGLTGVFATRHVDLAIAEDNKMGVLEGTARQPIVGGLFHRQTEVRMQRYRIDLLGTLNSSVAPGLVNHTVGHQHVNVLPESPETGTGTFRQCPGQQTNRWAAEILWIGFLHGAGNIHHNAHICIAGQRQCRVLRTCLPRNQQQSCSHPNAFEPVH